MKFVAMESRFFPNGRLGKSIPVNELVSVADDYKHSSHSAIGCYDRVKYCSEKYFNVINAARMKARYVRVEYFNSIKSGNRDAYELYVSASRATEIIANDENFVYKFDILSREVSDEYMMYA